MQTLSLQILSKNSVIAKHLTTSLTHLNPNGKQITNNNKCYRTTLKANKYTTH